MADNQFQNPNDQPLAAGAKLADFDARLFRPNAQRESMITPQFGLSRLEEQAMMH